MDKFAPVMISIPAYILSDAMIEELLFTAQETATELAGETSTDELPLLIGALRKEKERRL